MITTFPLDTRHASKIGFLSLFVYGGELARRYGSEFLPVLMGSIAELRSQFNLLNIACEPICYQDDDRRTVLPLIMELIHLGFLHVSERRLKGCLCGKVCIPGEAEIHATSTSLASTNIAACCNGPIQENLVRVLQTKKLEFSNLPLQCVPEWGTKEIIDMRRAFSERELVVSRTRATYITLNIDGQLMQIDNDMFVYLVQLLHSKPPSHLITGVTLVKQIVLYAHFAQVLGYTLPTIHFLPRVNYLGETPLAELCQRKGRERVIMKLLTCASSKKQIISFNDSGI